MTSIFPDDAIHQLQLTVDALSSRVSQLEQRDSPPCDPAAELASISEMTRAVFGKSPTIIPTFDPESDTAYVVVQVSAVGNDEAIAALVRAWHKRLANEFATGGVYSLSVVFD